MSIEVSVQDADALKQAIADVRSDHNPTSWCLAGHVDNKPNVINLLQSGTGSVDELVPLLDDGQVMYGIVRVQEQVEISTTTKFAYIRFVGEKVSFVKKGRFGVVAGAVFQHFNPAHVTFDITNRDEISAGIVAEKVAEASMTSNKILSSTEGRQMRGFTQGQSFQDSPNLNRVQKTQFTGVQAASKEGYAVSIDDSVRQGVSAVRSDADDTTWVLCGYQDNDVKNSIVLLEKGSGDTSAFVDKFRDDGAQYALYRTTDVYDGHTTVKFVFFAWLGEATGHMAKAKLSTHKGAVEEAFAPYHVDFKGISNKKFISEKEVKAKIEAASGSANKVRS